MPISCLFEYDKVLWLHEIRKRCPIPSNTEVTSTLSGPHVGNDTVSCAIKYLLSVLQTWKFRISYFVSYMQRN
jgi:hypothetical protein